MSQYSTQSSLGNVSFDSQSTDGDFSSGFGSNNALPFTYPSLNARFVLVRDLTSASGQASQSAQEPLNLSHSIEQASDDLEYINKEFRRIPRYQSYHLQRVLADSSSMDEYLNPRTRSPELDIFDISSQREYQILQDEAKSKQPKEYFVVGCFQGSLFKRLADADKKIVSPLAVNYWRRQLENNRANFYFDELLAKVTKGGLFSEAMNGNVVYLSKLIPRGTRVVLDDKITQMGGNTSPEFDIRVTHAVIEDKASARPGSEDPTVNAAYFFQVPIVNIAWINKAWIPLQLQGAHSSEKTFIQQHSAASRFTNLHPKQPPVLSNFTVGIIESQCTHSDNNKRNQMGKLLYQLHDAVVRFHGKFAIDSKNAMLFEASNVIVHVEDVEPGFNDDKMVAIYQRYASMKEFTKVQEIAATARKVIPLVRLDWLLKTILNEEFQPFEPYLITDGGRGGVGTFARPNPGQANHFPDDESMYNVDAAQFPNQIGWMAQEGGGGAPPMNRSGGSGARTASAGSVLVMKVQSAGSRTAK